jgi:hypothetical protein
MRCAWVFAVCVWALAGSSAAAAAQGVEIRHEGVGCVVAGQHPRLEATIEPSAAVGRARVHFRADGSASWYFVEMRPEAEGWVGVLPKPRATLARFSYYLEVTGAHFDERRTREYSPRVVSEGGECEERALVAAVSAVGPTVIGVPPGAPAAPAGFAPLSSATATVPADGAGEVAGSGGSKGLVLGVVGGAIAVGGGAIALAGKSDGTGSASQPSAPGGAEVVPPGVGPRPPQSLILALSNGCRLSGGVTIYVGDRVTVARGMCDWTTSAEAQSACAGQTATVTVDGAPLAGVRYFIGYDGGNGLVCASAEADWTAVAGSHVAAGIWTLPGSALDSCRVTVQP